MKKALLLAVLLSGCATAQKDYGYMQSAEFQARPTLNHSILGEEGKLSEEAVQKILSSKVKFSSALHVAVVRLSEGGDFQAIDENLARKFFAKENWGPRVKTVIPMPQILLPKPVTLSALRQAAVILQADALVVVAPRNRTDWSFHIFEKNRAKSTSSIEVLLLDTRTSVIPYTAVVSESTEVRDQNDFSNHELFERARKEAEDKALLQVPLLVMKFLQASP
jgi:hypothetical protein